MSLLPISFEHLQSLLARARQEHMRHEVVERLSWFSDFALHRSISRTCRTFGIARTTFYRWLKRFDPHDLRSLEDKPAPFPEKLRSCIAALHTVPADATPSVPVAVERPAETQAAPAPVARAEQAPETGEARAPRFAWSRFAMGLLCASVVINLILLFVLLGSPNTEALRARLLRGPDEAPCPASSSCPPQP